jgi:hypothetical protein
MKIFTINSDLNFLNSAILKDLHLILLLLHHQNHFGKEDSIFNIDYNIFNARNYLIIE